ncbi:MAG TPA: sigma-70 factor domain-containing protein, partial [Candidatus Krumholzibacteria bacterium]|nr:sigma-70 factor domain-containing protein [Candidatus Krumholzibacteria bacterium]
MVKATSKATTATKEAPVSAGRSSLDLYLNEIRRYPLLSREDEVELARKARAGDMKAQEKLVSSNLRFV